MIFSPKVCTPSSDFPYLVYRNRPVSSSRNIFSKLSCTPRAYVIYSLCLHRCSSHPICCSPFYDDWRRYHGNESSRQPDARPAREADPCLQPAADAVECSAGPVQYVGHRRRRPFLRPDRTRRSRIQRRSLPCLRVFSLALAAVSMPLLRAFSVQAAARRRSAPSTLPLP